MALNIKYKAITEDDMADLVQSLLMVKSIIFMGKRFIQTRLELKEGYYELQEAFDTIQMLIEPALTHFDHAMGQKAKNKKQRTHGA